MLDSSPELVVAYLGASKAGVVPNVVNGMLKPDEVRAVVADSGARLLVTDPDRWAALGPLRDGLGVRHVLISAATPRHDGARSFDAALAAPADVRDPRPPARGAGQPALHLGHDRAGPRG